jgi:hypothetical protein
MPVDASIPLQAGQGVTPIDPISLLTRTFALKQAQREADQQDQAAQQQSALQQYLQGPGLTGDNGLLNAQGLAGLQQFGKAGADIIKSNADATKTFADAGNTQQDVQTKKAALLGGALTALHDDPSDETVNTVLDSGPYANDPVAQQVKQRLLSTNDPTQRRALIASIANQTPVGQAAMKEVAPTFERVIEGTRARFVQTNPQAGPTGYVDQNASYWKNHGLFAGDVLSTVGATADTLANNATQIQTTGMNNATSLATTKMNNDTSSANVAAQNNPETQAAAAVAKDSATKAAALSKATAARKAWAQNMTQLTEQALQQTGLPQANRVATAAPHTSALGKFVSTTVPSLIGMDATDSGRQTMLLDATLASLKQAGRTDPIATLRGATTKHQLDLEGMAQGAGNMDLPTKRAILQTNLARYKKIAAGDNSDVDESGSSGTEPISFVRDPKTGKIVPQ